MSGRSPARAAYKARRYAKRHPAAAPVEQMHRAAIRAAIDAGVIVARLTDLTLTSADTEQDTRQ